MKTNIITEEGRVGVTISLSKKEFLRDETVVKTCDDAAALAVANGHEVMECVENKHTLISNTILDDLPFEITWWFKTKQEQTKRKPKTRPRKVNEQPEQ